MSGFLAEKFNIVFFLKSSSKQRERVSVFPFLNQNEP